MDPRIWKILLYFFITLFVTLMIVRFLRWTLKKIFVRMNRGDKVRFDPTSYSFITNALSFSLILLAFILFIFGIPELRVYGEKIFVGAGLLTIAVGFASQSALSNIIGGVFIVMFRPFRVNDVIAVNMHWGVVEDITLRHTVIRNFENRRVIIPNAVISSDTILNSSIGDVKICNHVEFSVAFEANVQKAFDIINDEALQHPFCIDARTQEDIELEKPQVLIRVTHWLDSGITIRANVWSEDAPSGFQMKCDLLRTVLKRFREEGIEIPYPHRTLVPKGVEEKSIPFRIHRDPPAD